jgi:hypothetical protein
MGLISFRARFKRWSEAFNTPCSFDEGYGYLVRRLFLDLASNDVQSVSSLAPIPQV